MHETFCVRSSDTRQNEIFAQFQFRWKEENFISWYEIWFRMFMELESIWISRWKEQKAVCLVKIRAMYEEANDAYKLLPGFIQFTIISIRISFLLIEWKGKQICLTESKLNVGNGFWYFMEFFFTTLRIVLIGIESIPENICGVVG